MPSQSSAVRALSVALLLIGITFIIGIYPLTRLWPSGWAWTPSQPEYLQMILVIYATLGVFLILAARDPLNNLSLIWFTVWSSWVHAGIIAVQAFMGQRGGHLFGDLPALVLVGVVLAVLTPKTLRPTRAAA